MFFWTFFTYFSVVAGLQKAFGASLPQRQRCAFGDACWPNQKQWHAFNESIDGRLVATHPAAAVCHTDQYDSKLCEVAKQDWTSSFWRTSQVGAYTAMLWEFGPTEQCYINSSTTAPCQQGLVPHFSVNASTVAHIQNAVQFAGEHDLYLAIKNTGHDHLGRSTAANGFAIWTHNIKGRTWHDTFIPHNAPRDHGGVSAVTLKAGEQWLDVYRDAAEHKCIVVGGAARTVGAAGGWLTGGGHSPFANSYGLGVDNVLELDMITPKGEHIILNQFTDPEYFWAVRGGGGSAWGLIYSVTYQTHPEPSGIHVGLIQVNATTNSSFRQAMSATLKALDNLTGAGYIGYSMIALEDPATPDVPATFGAVVLKPNGTNSTLEAATAPFLAMNNLPNVTSYVLPIEIPTWLDYIDYFLIDPNIAENVIDASRLLTPKIVHNDTANAALVDMIMEYGAGFNFIGRVNPAKRNETSVHPVWSESLGILSFGANWEDEAPLVEKIAKKKMVVEQSVRLGEIFGSDGGTYINEANPFEPDWEKVFWGSNYPKLVQVKKRIDPTNLMVCNRCVNSDVNFEP